jgi:hypothetical protein
MGEKSPSLQPPYVAKGVDTQRPYGDDGVLRYPQCGETPQRPDFSKKTAKLSQNHRKRQQIVAFCIFFAFLKLFFL